jgi:Ser/Thr protein kinase RdoA (MazF antagonist)
MQITPFGDLSFAAQIRRLRQLAQVALRAYDLDIVKLAPLTQTENTTFRVDGCAPHQPASASERYVLRISRPDAKSAAEIRSELLWLAALRHETDLVVPDPIVTTSGELLTTADAEGVPGPRHCVLFRWVPGRFLGHHVSAAAFGRVGAFMARLHLHAERFGSPAGFVRGRLDEGGLAELRAQFAAPGLSLSRDDRALIHDVLALIAAAMQALGAGQAVFGLIHGDLHQFNYLFHHGAVRAIDFDDCGWGYYLYDIAVAMLGAGDWRLTPEMRAAFFAGYRHVRALPQEYQAYLELFIGLRRVIMLPWILARAEQPDFQAWAPAFVARTLHELRELGDRRR